jgi:hypothetical protein
MEGLEALDADPALRFRMHEAERIYENAEVPRIALDPKNHHVSLSSITSVDRKPTLFGLALCHTGTDLGSVVRIDSLVEWEQDAIFLPIEETYQTPAIDSIARAPALLPGHGQI